MSDLRPNHYVIQFFEDIGVDPDRLSIHPEPDEDGFYQYMLNRDGQPRMGRIDYEREFVRWDEVECDRDLVGPFGLYGDYKAARRQDFRDGNAYINW